MTPSASSRAPLIVVSILAVAGWSLAFYLLTSRADPATVHAGHAAATPTVHPDRAAPPIPAFSDDAKADARRYFAASKAALRVAPGFDELSRDMFMWSFIKAEIAAGNLDDATRDAAGLGPGGFQSTYLAEVLRARAKAGDVEGAKQGIKLAAPGSDDNDRRRLWIGVIQGQLDAGRLAEALQTATALDDLPNAKAEALYRVAVAHVKAGNLTVPQELVETPFDEECAVIMDGKAVTRASEWHSEFQSEILGCLAAASVRAGNLPGAMALAKRAFKPDAVLLSIAAAQAEAGDLAGATHTIEGMDERGLFPQGDAWCAVIRAQAGRGDLTGALATINAHRDTGDDPWLLEDLVKLQLRKDDVAGAKMLVAALQDEKGRLEMLGLVAQVQARTGHLTDALAMADAAQGDEFERGRVYARIIDGAVEAGDVAGAKRVAEQMFKQDTPERGWSLIASYWLTKALAEAGDVAGADQALATFNKGSDRPESQGQIAAARARKEGFPAAVRWVEAQAKPEARVHAYYQLARARLGLPPPPDSEWQTHTEQRDDE